MKVLKYSVLALVKTGILNPTTVYKALFPNLSALDSRSSSPSLSPGCGTALCSWAKLLTPISATLHPGV